MDYFKDYKEGYQKHHGDGVTEIHKNGEIRWEIYGQAHRDNDLPAIIDKNGKQLIWCQYGKEHRDNDKPAWIDEHCEEWWLNGEQHRENGPALICKNGLKAWWINGERHREDGPAVINEDGTEEWWINDEKLSQRKINAIKRKQELQKELPINEGNGKSGKTKI